MNAAKLVNDLNTSLLSSTPFKYFETFDVSEDLKKEQMPMLPKRQQKIVPRSSSLLLDLPYSKTINADTVVRNSKSKVCKSFKYI